MKALGFLPAVLLAVSLVQPARAQEASIRGRVTDSTSHSPLAGVQVTFGKKSALSVTDGRFVLTGVAPGTDTLKVRMLGYAPLTRVVTVSSGQTLNLDFSLTAQAVSLSEIVVTGYGQQSAGNITGAVTQVSTEEFNQGRVINPAQLIATKVPGVQVVDNNEPGGGITIRIRGATSVNASSDPLYVIDGMPIGTGGGGGGLSLVGKDPLNFLNPEDIQSITVLRDASAAAIYGANAANGVVLITTKSRIGQAGKFGTHIEYTGNMSSSAVDRLPSMLNAEQFRAAVQQYAPQNVGQLGNANTNWFDQTTGTAFGQEHNVALTSTQEKSFFRLSLGYLNQDGVVDGTTAERLSLTANYQQLLFKDRLNLRANLKGSQTEDRFTPGGVLSNSAQFGPTQPILDQNSPTGYFEWPGNTLQSADNPAAILGLASDKGTTFRSVGNVRAEYQMPFLPALTANLNMGYDVTEVDRTTFTPRVLHSQTKSGTYGTDYRTNPSMANTVLETYLGYAAPAGFLPGNLDMAAGYSYNYSTAEYPWYQGTGLSTDVLEGNGVTSATTQQNGMDVQQSKLISFFGRLNWNLNDTYLLSFSLRHDGSSRFGADNAWGTFPSVSVGWRLSEGLFSGVDWLSDLKLRGSWAKTGNQAFANYQQYSSYRFGDNQSAVQFGNQWIPTIRPSAVDPNIKWESTEAYNVGLDFGFSNQRFTGTIDWYTKNTDGLIFNIPVAAGTNLSNFVTTNIGAMKNTGIELGLSWLLAEGRNGGLGYTATFSAAHNHNELTSISGSVHQILVGGIAGGVGSTIEVLRPGQPINSFFTYEHKMVDGKPVYEDLNGDQTINEQDLYVDQNGDGVINVDDRRPLHDPAPDWTFGHSSYLTYGRFGLNFTLRAYLGNYVYNNVASNLGSYIELTRASPYNLQSSVLETNFATPQYLSDYYVEDASFLRMDNITLDYRFDIGGQPWRVFGTLQNAFTITGYSGVDPTAGINGIDNNIYPRARTFTAGLSLRF